MLAEELSHFIFMLALNANVNHNGKMIAISGILSNSDNGGIFFFSLVEQLIGK